MANLLLNCWNNRRKWKVCIKKIGDRIDFLRKHIGLRSPEQYVLINYFRCDDKWSRTAFYRSRMHESANEKINVLCTTKDSASSLLSTAWHVNVKLLIRKESMNELYKRKKSASAEWVRVSCIRANSRAILSLSVRVPVGQPPFFYF